MRKNNIFNIFFFTTVLSLPLITKTADQLNPRAAFSTNPSRSLFLQDNALPSSHSSLRSQDPATSTMLLNAGNQGEVAEATLLATAGATRMARRLATGTALEQIEDIERNVATQDCIQFDETAANIKLSNLSLQSKLDVAKRTQKSRLKLAQTRHANDEQLESITRWKHQSNTGLLVSHSYLAAAQKIGLPLVVGRAIIEGDIKLAAVYAIGSLALYGANRIANSEALQALWLGKEKFAELKEFKDKQIEKEIERRETKDSVNSLQQHSLLMQNQKAGREQLETIIKSNNPAEEPNPRLKQIKQEIVSNAKATLLTMDMQALGLKFSPPPKKQVTPVGTKVNTEAPTDTAPAAA